MLNAPLGLSFFIATPIYRLGAECEELSQEFPVVADVNTDARDKEDGAGPAVDRLRLVSELGDVLFDALMLNGACTRAFGLDPEAAWNAAVEKVERRTPYVPC